MQILFRLKALSAVKVCEEALRQYENPVVITLSVDKPRGVQLFNDMMAWEGEGKGKALELFGGFLLEAMTHRRIEKKPWQDGGVDLILCNPSRQEEAPLGAARIIVDQEGALLFVLGNERRERRFAIFGDFFLPRPPFYRSGARGCVRSCPMQAVHHTSDRSQRGTRASGIGSHSLPRMPGPEYVLPPHDLIFHQGCARRSGFWLPPLYLSISSAFFSPAFALLPISIFFF